ncbi:amylo-alpha-1,6-glucosidase [Microlunatus endophyticus]|nr:glycogen debranching N-terminal domain-containing protein [Microlunatus endophyticus]
MSQSTKSQSALPSAPIDEVAAAAGALSREAEVTLVEGSTFCLSDKSGSISGAARGLYYKDTRVLSALELTVDGVLPDILTVVPDQAYSCRFVGRGVRRESEFEATLLIERRRWIGAGLREDITLSNHATQDVRVRLDLRIDADFADIFEIRGIKGRERTITRHSDAGRLELRLENAVDQRSVLITAAGWQTSPDGLTVETTVPARGSWTGTVQVAPGDDDHDQEPTFTDSRPVAESVPALRAAAWNAAAPKITVGHPGLDRALTISRRDLGALRIFDEDHPEDAAVAAGAPWFMTLFGRDSLLTSAMMLPYFGDLALGTLRSLARLQGTTDNPQNEEQPGKILHEIRKGSDPSLSLGGTGVYYGSIDSTPLFVVVVAQALRWGQPIDAVAELMPAVDRAMSWITDYGDRDGDVFLEYERTADHGLDNQGWKDSGDSISFADGRLATGSIALAEVQGYAYAAFRARAELARAFGEDQQPWLDRAADLQRRFHQAFWLPEQGFYAIALDGTKTPVDTATSNIGHCLWSGIVPDDVAGQVVERLMSPGMFTGFGIRTLADDAGRYNPASYHNGSVWPHDTVLVAAGIARYGFRAEAERILAGLLDAADSYGGRLPELLCGFGRDEVPTPVPYPTACSPQAWAAAVPYQLLTTALGLDADLPQRRLTAGPAMAVLGATRVSGLRVGPASLTLVADQDFVEVTGLPFSVTVTSTD